MSDDVNEWNQQVIAEFRANDGVVGGPFEGMPVLLLHHIGAKSGTERVNPLVYRRDGDAWVIFASKGGAPDNPDWLYNLRANPEVSIEVGADTVTVRAAEVAGAERDRIFDAHKAEFPQFAEYERNTSRTIPVVVLRPV